MPPAPRLGRAVADWQPSERTSVGWFGVTAVFGATSLFLVAAKAYGFLVTTLPLTLLASLAWQEARRSYLVVGDDWLYVRRLGGARWTHLAGVESARVTGRGGTTLLLRGPSFRGPVPVPSASLWRPTAFHEELARRLLAGPVKASAQATSVLHAWAGLVAPGPGDE